MARLLFFGKLGDIAGGRVRDFPLPEGVCSIAALKEALGADDASLASALQEPSVRLVINEEIASADAAITDEDEIAFLPPVSGG